MRVALVREPAPLFVNALSNHPEKSKIDFNKACRQHNLYVEALKRAGITVICLKACKFLPDAPFIEDTALILEDRALISSMKAVSRQGETELVISELRKYRPLEILKPPIFIDGGDVLNAGGSLYVGVSRRTNLKAVEFLKTQTRKPVIPVPILKGLHLKSAVSCLNEETLLLDPSRIDTSALKKFQWIKVGEKESWAANCLVIGSNAIMPQGYPCLVKKVEDLGLNVISVPMSEFEKADGGVTCLSLIISDLVPPPED